MAIAGAILCPAAPLNASPPLPPARPLCLQEASGKLRTIFAPIVARMDAQLAPLRAGLAFTTTAASMREETQQSELVRRLKATLVNHA